MANLQSNKGKPLTRDNIVILLNIITNNKVITSKSTNATNNKLKEDAWKSISQEFSALTGDSRRPDQLRLKWENLKKSARKRSALIRQNNIKTGGGKAFIPPDEVLERVESILGSTCTRLSVEFGGDGVIEEGQSSAEVKPISPSPDLPQTTEIEMIYTPKNFVFNTPNKGLNKRRKLLEDGQKAQREKDLAMAAYFRAKEEKVRLENKKLELENIKLDIEIRELKKN